MPIVETSDATTRCRWDTDLNLYQRFRIGADAVEELVEERPLIVEELDQFAADATNATRGANRAQLIQAARTALQTNQAFLGLGQPTTAQALAQVGALTRQVDAIIRIVGGLVDASDLLDQTS